MGQADAIGRRLLPYIDANDILFIHIVMIPWAMTMGDKRYEEAAALVSELLKIDADCIKKLRSIEPHFYAMTGDTFSKAGLNAPFDLIKKLLSPFPYTKST
jgi:hypothetical protein